MIDGDSYRKLREDAGLSRTDLAKAAGVPYSVIATLERGARPRGGDAMIERVNTELRRETGLRVEAEQRASEGMELHPGSVITARRRDTDLLLKVQSISEDGLVHAVEMLTASGDAFTKMVRLGAQTHRHNGKMYLLRNFRTVRLDEVIRHWTDEAPDEPTTIAEVDDKKDDDDGTDTD
jgi:transcriptional regulator with XRE-family HTH domain